MIGSTHNPSILEEIGGAGGIALSLLVSPLLRPWYSSWGATNAEARNPLPGDAFVTTPILESTRAITIRAPAEAVWPWLVQMGQGRGGLYSYERLENLVGCEIHNADRIVSEYQQIEVGDKVRLAPEGRGPFFVISAIESGRSIVLGGDDPPTSWAFVLEPQDDATTRLIIRFRQRFEKSLSNILVWRVFTDPIGFWMERKMLQGIKKRVEGYH